MPRPVPDLGGGLLAELALVAEEELVEVDLAGDASELSGVADEGAPRGPHVRVHEHVVGVPTLHASTKAEVLVGVKLGKLASEKESLSIESLERVLARVGRLVVASSSTNGFRRLIEELLVGDGGRGAARGWWGGSPRRCGLGAHGLAEACVVGAAPDV